MFGMMWSCRLATIQSWVTSALWTGAEFYIQILSWTSQPLHVASKETLLKKGGGAWYVVALQTLSGKKSSLHNLHIWDDLEFSFEFWMHMFNLEKVFSIKPHLKNVFDVALKVIVDSNQVGFYSYWSVCLYFVVAVLYGNPRNSDQESSVCIWGWGLWLKIFIQLLLCHMEYMEGSNVLLVHHVKHFSIWW